MHAPRHRKHPSTVAHMKHPKQYKCPSGTHPSAASPFPSARGGPRTSPGLNRGLIFDGAQSHIKLHCLVLQPFEKMFDYWYRYRKEAAKAQQQEVLSLAGQVQQFANTGDAARV